MRATNAPTRPAKAAPSNIAPTRATVINAVPTFQTYESSVVCAPGSKLNTNGLQHRTTLYVWSAGTVGTETVYYR